MRFEMDNLRGMAYTCCMPDIIRVLVADDSAAMRRAIAALFAPEPYIRLCGEAEDYPELLRMLGECGPDVVLIDVRMPGASEIDGAAVKAHFHGSCLIAMSFSNDREAVSLAESLGAFKLLDKMELGTTLMPTIYECLDKSRKVARA
jgi:chemotaxis response regulator CheB